MEVQYWRILEIYDNCNSAEKLGGILYPEGISCGDVIIYTTGFHNEK